MSAVTVWLRCFWTQWKHDLCSVYSYTHTLLPIWRLTRGLLGRCPSTNISESSNAVWNLPIGRYFRRPEGTKNSHHHDSYYEKYPSKVRVKGLWFQLWLMTSAKWGCTPNLHITSGRYSLNYSLSHCLNTIQAVVWKYHASDPNRFGGMYYVRNCWHIEVV